MMGTNRKKALIICSLFAVALVIILAIVAVVYINNNNEPIYPSNDPRAGAAKSERINKNAYQEVLEEKDYETYQEGILSLTYAFIEAKDYAGAQKRLDRILDNVPENKLSIHTYMALSEVAQKRSDTKKYETYTTTLIEKLKKDGRKAEVEQYKKQLAEAKQGG